MATQFVVSTKNHLSQIAPDAGADIGGTVFVARCPKDSLWALMAKANQDGDFTADHLSPEARDDMGTFVAAIFSPEDTKAIEEMLADPHNTEVTLDSLSGAMGELISYWAPYVEKHLAKLQDSGNRKERRTLARAEPSPPTSTGTSRKKTAVKKATASKTASAAARR